MNGEEFDTITATQSWSNTVHDLRMRKAIRRCMAEGRLLRRDSPDPIADYIKLKAAEALTAKKPRNELAHALRVKKQSTNPSLDHLPKPNSVTKLKRSKAPCINVSGRTFNY